MYLNEVIIHVKRENASFEELLTYLLMKGHTIKTNISFDELKQKVDNRGDMSMFDIPASDLGKATRYYELAKEYNIPIIY